jgi:hypothetical protein
MQQKRTLDMQMIETLSKLNKNRLETEMYENSPAGGNVYLDTFRNGMNSTASIVRHSDGNI